jgi:hypothetical protein
LPSEADASPCWSFPAGCDTVNVGLRRMLIGICRAACGVGLRFLLIDLVRLCNLDLADPAMVALVEKHGGAGCMERLRQELQR